MQVTTVYVFIRHDDCSTLCPMNSNFPLIYEPYPNLYPIGYLSLNGPVLGVGLTLFILIYYYSNENYFCIFTGYGLRDLQGLQNLTNCCFLSRTLMSVYEYIYISYNIFTNANKKLTINTNSLFDSFRYFM